MERSEPWLNLLISSIASLLLGSVSLSQLMTEGTAWPIGYGLASTPVGVCI